MFYAIFKKSAIVLVIAYLIIISQFQRITHYYDKNLLSAEKEVSIRKIWINIIDKKFVVFDVDNNIIIKECNINENNNFSKKVEVIK